MMRSSDMLQLHVGQRVDKISLHSILVDMRPLMTITQQCIVTDPLYEKVRRIRGFSESAKRRAGVYSDIAGINDRPLARSLGSVQRASAPGKKIQKVGFIMLWIPEPTMITAAVGGPIILAGRYLDKKYNGSTIHDVGRQTSDTMNTIRDFGGAINP